MGVETIKRRWNVKIKEEMIDEYMRKYSEHHCLLVKRYRTVFHYVWVLEANENKFKIHVGKSLYHRYRIGSQLTIGRIGKKLVNIRSEIVKNDK